MNNNITEDFFDEEICNSWGNNATFDGITDIEEYQKASVKILWILKEANNGAEENPILFYHLDLVKVHLIWALILLGVRNVLEGRYRSSSTTFYYPCSLLRAG